MARSIGLSAYKLEIRNQRSRSSWRFELGGEEDGFAAMLEYMQSRHGHLVTLGDVDRDTGELVDKRAIKLVKLEHDANQGMLAGMFMKGEAGLVQQVHDVLGQVDDPVYTIQKDQAPLSPLYFRMHFVDGRQYGVALLQTFGKDGLKGYLADDMRRYFGSLAEPLTVKLVQLVDAQVLEQFARQGKLQDVVVINSGKSQASREYMEEANVGGSSLGDDGDKLSLRLHKKEGWPGRILRHLVELAQQKEGNPRELVDVPGVEAMDDLLVEVKRGSRVQTFSLLNPDDSPIRQDVTDLVRRGDDGFPEWDSIHEVGAQAFDDINELLRGRGAG